MLSKRDMTEMGFDGELKSRGTKKYVPANINSAFDVPKNRTLKGVECLKCGKPKLTFTQVRTGLVKATCDACGAVKNLRLSDFQWVEVAD